MNPDSFFREVLESHQFRSSDIPTHFSLDPMLNLNCLATYLHMSDNVNLLDITLTNKMRRFMRYYLEISAAQV
jgi:hypothetical protein